MTRKFSAFRLLGMALTASILTFSCKKKDEERPNVVIEFPSDGAHYNVGDTIFIGISASDNVSLESVRAMLTSLDGLVASSSETAFPNTNPFTGVLEVVIEDRYLEPGEYTIRVTASDRSNEGFDFVRVNVSEFPKERRSIIAVIGSGNATIQKIDSLGSISTLLSLSHDASGVCVNNRDNLALIVGNIDGNVSAVDLLDGSVSWNETWPDQPPAPAFLSHSCDDSDLLISGYDHTILGFDQLGSLIINEDIGSFRPEKMIVEDGQLLVEQVQSGTPNRFMFHYNRSSLALQNNVGIDMNAVSICRFDESRVMLFGNDGGAAKVLMYDFLGNFTWEPRLLQPSEVFDAVKGSGQVYYIAQSDGIYSYTVSPNYLNLIVPGVQAFNLRYDEDRNVLLASTGSTIHEYSISGNVLTIHQFQDQVISFDIHYTK